jgi:hypothetical protein
MNPALRLGEPCVGQNSEQRMVNTSTAARRFVVAILSLALAGLSGCAGQRPQPGIPSEREQNVGTLMRLDNNGDGLIDRLELDTALRRDYELADGNRDGQLSPDEAVDENARRWRLEGPAATPLIDWNQDGTVDFLEFANATRGLFDLMDTNRNGALSMQELTVARRPPPPARGRGGVVPRTP